MSYMNDATPSTGLELRLLRVAADVRPRELAIAMGVTAQRISNLEGQRTVTVTAAQRYLAALAMLATNQTEKDVA